MAKHGRHAMRRAVGGKLTVSTTTTKINAPRVRIPTRYYVVRSHHTDQGILSVFAERDGEGKPRSHGSKLAAFTAAGFMGGRAAGFHVMETRHNERGDLVDVSFPRGDNS